MNPALVVLNPRRIPAVIDTLNQHSIPKVWITGYTEAEIAAGVFARMVEETSFSHYIVLSDDCEPHAGAIDTITDYARDFTVTTGWCQVDESNTTVNLCDRPLKGDEPVMDAYSFIDRAQVMQHANHLRTHFAGMSLTCMTRDMWRLFPFGVFAPERGGWASDFHLSIRLRNAGIPITAPVLAECTHHREDWQKPDPTLERRLLIGEIEPAVTIT